MTAAPDRSQQIEAEALLSNADISMHRPTALPRVRFRTRAAFGHTACYQPTATKAAECFHV